MHRHYLFLSFIILVVASVSQGDKEQDSICAPTDFNCGDINSVSHPFSDGGLPTKCRIRGFELYCSSDGYLMINISSEVYRVRSINYPTKTFVIVDIGVILNNCPSHRKIQRSISQFLLVQTTM